MKKIAGSTYAAPIIILILTLALWTPALARSLDPSAPKMVELTDEQGKYPLGYYLEILKDPQGKMTIEDVSSPEYDSQFIPSRVAVPNYGVTNHAYWVRFHVRNNASRTDRWLIELGFTNMQYADLYLPAAGGEGWAARQSGLLRPFNTHDVVNRHFVFELLLPTRTEQTYYMRFQNGGSMTLPLTLWQPEAFFQEDGTEQLFFGFYYGALVMILIYNLFVLYSLRDASNFYYVCFLAGIILWSVTYDGFAAAYLWPKLYIINGLAVRFFYVFVMASILMFTDTFLELKTRSPGLHRMIMFMMAGWGIAFLLTFFLRSYLITLIVLPYGIFTLIVAGVAAIISWRAGVMPARFFLFSWLGFFIGAIVIIFVREGLTASTEFNENMLRLGILWLAAFWSISLTDRVNLLKSEMAKANRALQSSEHQLSQILEGLPLAVVLYGQDRKPRYGNKRTYDILSNPARGILPSISAGRTLDMALDYYALKKAGTDQAYPLQHFPVYSALHGQAASVDDIEADLGDRRVPLEIWASPITGETGNVESAVVAFQDITQRKQAEAELDGYRLQLEALVEERTTDLNKVNRKLELRLGWLSVVNKVHDSIAGTSSLEGVYTELSNEILRLLVADLVFIHRWDGPGESFGTLSHSPEMKASYDISFMKSLFQKGSPLRHEIELGKIVTYPVEQAASLAGRVGEHTPQPDPPWFVFAPIKIGQSAIGVLGLAASTSSQNLIWEEAVLIEWMALDLASLAQGAMLLDQAVLLATVQERNRLARELHDSVTQTLFTASVLAEATPHIWERDQGIARQNMGKLSRLIRGALAEMRSMLIELRMGDLHRQTLEQLLVTLVDGAQARSQAAISLSLPEDLPKLPERIIMCFYRIAREAINNATVHSGASRIQVILSREQAHWLLQIQDNGCSFDPQLVPEGHLGISIMGERAKEIGASLQIQPEPGLGTLISIAWSDEIGETTKNE
jgi:signal transduction histidine kinase/PAS domain-containing protein